MGSIMLDPVRPISFVHSGLSRVHNDDRREITDSLYTECYYITFSPQPLAIVRNESQ